MRNYIEMFVGTFHVHKDTPLIDLDAELWRATALELDAAFVAARAEWEGAGYVFTEKTRSPAYWELDKANFVKIIMDFAEVNNLLPYKDASDPFLVFESPRGREKRRFRLTKL